MMPGALEKAGPLWGSSILVNFFKPFRWLSMGLLLSIVCCWLNQDDDHHGVNVRQRVAGQATGTRFPTSPAQLPRGPVVPRFNTALNLNLTNAR